MRVTSLRGARFRGEPREGGRMAGRDAGGARRIPQGLILLGGTILLALWTGLAGAQEVPELSRPLGVDELVRLALERNLGISQSEQAVERASGNRKTALSAYVPKAYIGTDYGYSRSRFDRIVVDPNTGRVTASADDIADEIYSLSLRGNLSLVNLSDWYTIKQAGRSVEAARGGLQGTRSETVLAVKQQYYSLIRSKELARVSREDYDLRQDQLRRAQSLFELGSVARSDVLQAQVNLATADRERIAAENDVETQRARLAVLLALPVDAPLQVADPQPLVDPIEREGEELLVQQAFVQRPDLAQARASAEAARYGEKAARWGWAPSISGSYYYSKQEDHLGDLFTDLDRNRRWGLGLGLTWPLFDGFQTSGSIQRATSDRRSQEDALQQKRLDVALEVREALLGIKTATEGIRSARDGVALAEESVRLQRALYENGGGTLLEWNNAQVELTRARVALIDAEVDLRLAHANLEKALGDMIP